MHIFDFKILRRLVCKYAQTTDYKEGWQKVKEDYKNFFEESIPYPIQDFQVEYDILINWLENECENQNLFDIDYMTKTEMFEWGWTDKLIAEFEVQPDIKKRRKNDFGYYYLYNRNRIISLMESDSFQISLEARKAKKAKYLSN